MSYLETLMNSLQNSFTTQVKLHTINDNTIMEIFYEEIVEMLVDDLDKAGYTIINKQQ
jgi:deoxyadenosine/deoxycytidine kinase